MGKKLGVVRLQEPVWYACGEPPETGVVRCFHNPKNTCGGMYFIQITSNVLINGDFYQIILEKEAPGDAWIGFFPTEQDLVVRGEEVQDIVARLTAMLRNKFLGKP